MGTLSLSKAGRLYWLGRYSERVYASLKATNDIFEADVDGREADYGTYCRQIGEPDIYKNTADFCRRYYFDPKNEASVLANLGRAYDNAIVLRETLSSETLAYVQMAMNAMERAAGSPAPALALQEVRDDLMAFRGSADEKMQEEASRATLKTGVSIERADLYLRLSHPKADVRRELERLFDRLYKTPLKPDRARLDFLTQALLDEQAEDPGTPALIAAVEKLFPDV